MKQRPSITTVIPYDPLKCRVGKGCPNVAKHIVTIRPDPNVVRYKTIHMCDGHLAKLREDAEGSD